MSAGGVIPDTLLISRRPGQIRSLLAAGERGLRLTVTSSGLAGAVFLGRVAKRPKGLNGAFVELAPGRAGVPSLAGFLPLGPDSPLGEGDLLPLQVVAEPQGDKAAKVRAEVVLDGHGGRYFPLEDRWEGVEGAESAFWRARWQAARRPDQAGLWLAPLDPAQAALLDAPEGLTRVAAEDGLSFAALRAFAQTLRPDLAPLLSPLTEDDAALIDETIEEALAPEIALPSGGRLIIEGMAALTAIDVNSARQTQDSADTLAARVNAEAADEIARQIGLRNLAGLIVVDFLRRKRRGLDHQAAARLKERLHGDPAGAEVAGFTRLGLLEISRRRLRAPLADVLRRPCPACGGSGLIASAETVALAGLAAFEREARAHPGARLHLRASPAVLAAFDREPARAARRALEERLGFALPVAAAPELAADAFDLAPHA